MQQGSDDGVFGCQLVGGRVVEGDRHSDTGGGEHLDEGVTVCLQDRTSFLEVLRGLHTPKGRHECREYNQ